MNGDKTLLEAAQKVIAHPSYFLECPGDDDGQPCQQCQERQALVDAVHQASLEPTAPQGRKDDGGKLRFDLIPAGPLEDLARVYTMGAAKYADRNWERGISWGRIFGAIMRHLWAFWRGEDLDPESGLPHTAHAAWGCFALLEYRRTHPELDDRARD